MHRGDVIEDLICSYFTKSADKPGLFEVMAIKNALAFVEDTMDEGTYQSNLEWVERHLAEYSGEEI